jgi:hypothetical protein
VIIAARLRRENTLAIAEDDTVAIVMKGATLVDEGDDLPCLRRKIGERDLPQGR